MKYKRYTGSVCLLLLSIFIVSTLLISGCSHEKTVQPENSDPSRQETVLVTGNGIMHEQQMTLIDMLKLPDAQFEHIYSVINNWPVEKKLAAKGIKIAALLQAAGIKDEAKCITIKGEDGYECSFTREQMLETKRYHFPGVMDRDTVGAELVEPIIAYEYMENTDQLNEARADSLCLIMPQANVNEQTYHTFVKGVEEIVVSEKNPGKWDTATIYPDPGSIAKGDKAKLQHKEIGKVKMYYTMDGSNPTVESTLYNPSTYQPELNQPIVIDQDTTIKILTKGFGKYDSDIAEYHYKVNK